MKCTDSLAHSTDFRRVYRRGRSYGEPLLVLYAYHNRSNGGRNRLGIVAGKKVGNSVKRHRAKRLIKEAYRLAEQRLRMDTDLVVVARPGAPEATFAEIQRQLLSLMKRHRLLV